MPLGRKVGVDPSDIVLDGDQAPSPESGQSPKFSAHVYCGETVAYLSQLLLSNCSFFSAVRLS